MAQIISLITCPLCGEDAYILVRDGVKMKECHECGYSINMPLPLGALVNDGMIAVPLTNGKGYSLRKV